MTGKRFTRQFNPRERLTSNRLNELRREFLRYSSMHAPNALMLESGRYDRKKEKHRLHIGQIAACRDLSFGSGTDEETTTGVSTRVWQFRIVDAYFPEICGTQDIDLHNDTGPTFFAGSLPTDTTDYQHGDLVIVAWLNHRYWLLPTRGSGGGGGGADSSTGDGFCPLCCLEIPTPICPTVECTFCPDGSPEVWVIETVEGVSAGTCPEAQCELYNGSHLLSYEGGCIWSKRVSASTLCSAEGLEWILQISADPVGVQLFGANAAPTMVLYELPLSEFDCLGPNTLTLSSSDPDCTGWPDTITIRPAEGSECDETGTGTGTDGGPDCVYCDPHPDAYYADFGVLDCCGGTAGGVKVLSHFIDCTWRSNTFAGEETDLGSATGTEGIDFCASMRWILEITDDGATLQLIGTSDGSDTVTLLSYASDGVFCCWCNNVFSLVACPNDDFCNCVPRRVCVHPRQEDAAIEECFEITDCVGCPDGAPATWTFTVEGVTGDLCDDDTCESDMINGDRLLVHISGCVWQEIVHVGQLCTPPIGGVSSVWAWILDRTPTQWRVIFNLNTPVPGRAVYTIPIGEFDCQSTNIFTLESFAEFCAEWPETIELTPADSSGATCLVGTGI